MVTTSGQSSYTPLLLRTTASLELISTAMRSQRYDRDPAGEGWGSVYDDTDAILGKITRQRPAGGKAELLTALESYPDQVRARYYWNEFDGSQLEYDAQGEASLFHRLRACDVTLADTGNEGEYFVLLSESQPRRLKRVLDGLTDTIEAVSDAVFMNQDDNPLSFGDDDFFLWVLYRATHDAALNGNLALVEIRSLSNESIRSRITSMGKGVDLSRPELVTLISDQSNRFGPVRFVVWSEDLQLTLYLQIKKSGEFSIYRGDSYYDDPDMFDLPEEEQRLRLLQDAAFHVIPELKHLYSLDAEWRDTNRADFYAYAKSAMKAYMESL
ncbi:hypothetical protein [Nocardioides sp. Iso805N]|uniref:hypothetical protein n=1 Tax=Nocardioides sp. Iso805N TaxID=1283287 RepID=UPI000372572C|nr:hypothetical protein [Nocardioides sp. Iso805N]